jgi:hypothetical protein
MQGRRESQCVVCVGMSEEDENDVKMSHSSQIALELLVKCITNRTGVRRVD